MWSQIISSSSQTPKMAILPSDDYCLMTIFLPCPEVVIISDKHCIVKSFAGGPESDGKLDQCGLIVIHITSPIALGPIGNLSATLNYSGHVACSATKAMLRSSTELDRQPSRGRQPSRASAHKWDGLSLH